MSPEHSITGEPVAADAATADGSRVANMMAKIAARNASDRFSDQCSEEDEDTPLPYLGSRKKGRRLPRGELSGEHLACGSSRSLGQLSGHSLMTAVGASQTLTAGGRS